MRELATISLLISAILFALTILSWLVRNPPWDTDDEEDDG